MTNWLLSEVDWLVSSDLVVSFRSSTFTSDSAVRIHRPRYLLGLGPYQQGGCQQANLLARGPMAH